MYSGFYSLPTLRRQREETVKMQLEDSLSSARVDLVDISGLKKKYIANKDDTNDEASVQDLETQMRTAYTSVKSHGDVRHRSVQGPVQGFALVSPSHIFIP